MSLLISASTNPPNQQELLKYIESLDKTEVDYIHCDVMDGKFVTSKTFDYKMVAEIKKNTTKKLDVHLMVSNPTKTIKNYVKNGADIVTIHFEAYKNKKKLLKDLLNIRKFGAFAGLSFCPTTNVDEIEPYLFFCDMLLVMSVTPGKSGQKFIEETYKKLKDINKFLNSQNIDIVIEVDGGVNESNAKKLNESGVQIVVLGAYLYSSSNLNNAIEKIKSV